MTPIKNEQRKIRVIVNAFSGTSSKSNIADLFQSHLDHSKYDYDLHFTQFPNHGTELAKEAVDQNYYMVIAVGGDGTVNEVAKEVVNSKVILGVIPGGSGNGFAMHLGMGRNISKAIKKINTGEAIEIDTCFLNNHFFINIAGAGFDAWVAYQKSKSKMRGLKMYVWGAIREAFRFKSQLYKITADDAILEGKFFTIAVANATMYGYNFTIAPKAKLTDNLFDLILIKDAPKWKLFFAMFRVINKSLHKSKYCIIKKVSKVEIQCEDTIPFHFDGEGFYEKGPLVFTLNPLSLRVLIPREKIIT